MTDELNKYLHGTVWVWPLPGKPKDKNRLALVISNNQANAVGETVNCVSVTSGVEHDYINVPLATGPGYQIQCDQIHTVPKVELTEYAGALPHNILSAVKALIRNHFEMGEIEEEANVRKVLAEAVNGLTKLIGKDETTSNLTKLKDKGKSFAELTQKGYAISYSKMVAESRRAKEENTVKPNKPEQTEKPVEVSAPSGVEPEPVSEPPIPVKKEQRRVRQPKNPPEQPEITKGKGGRRPALQLTTEDEEFILDTSNSTEEIMKKYELKDKRSVYDARNNIKQRRKRAQKENQ